MKLNSSLSSGIFELIQQAVAYKFENTEFYFLYGSTLTQSYKKNSDIDLVIVKTELEKPFREKFLYKGFLFDALVFDKESLNGAIQSARSSGQFAIVNAVIAAMILPNETVAAKQLKAIAGKTKQDGYSFRSKSFYQQFITNIIDDLESSTIEGERNVLCVELYRVILIIFLIINGAGFCTGKQIFRELSVMDSEKQARLNFALIESLQGRTSSLLDFGIEILDLIGGPLREGFKSEILPIIRMPLPII